MIRRLKGKLEFLGFPAADGDSDILETLLQDASKKIMAEIGLCYLPEKLENIAVDMAAGEYLFAKKAGGNLQGFDSGTAVKQIQEGDTSVTYAIGDGAKSQEERLDELISHFREMPSGIAAAWRKMRW